MNQSQQQHQQQQQQQHIDLFKALLIGASLGEQQPYPCWPCRHQTTHEKVCLFLTSNIL